MKPSCALVASVLAASTMSLSSSSFSADRDLAFSSCSQQGNSHSASCSSSTLVGKGKSMNSCAKQQASAVTEKFAPKFDGLRFIETLITAHR